MSVISKVINSRNIPLTAFVRVKDVIRALGCSKSTAYAHLGRAAGRAEGDRSLFVSR